MHDDELKTISKPSNENHPQATEKLQKYILFITFKDPNNRFETGVSLKASVLMFI